MPHKQTAQDSDALPRDIIPVHYALELTPDLDSFKFDGIVAANIKVVVKTKKIVLHALDIDIKNVSFTQNGAELVPESSSYDKDFEQHTFLLSKELEIGDAEFKASFVGCHNNTMSGFYRSKYRNPGEDVDKFMVVTQFEPTAARQAFPCWDEPLLKATFDVTLNIPNHLQAISNMEPKSSTSCNDVKKNYKRIVFNRTPVMSTYLLAFAVGELEFIEGQTAVGNQWLPDPIKVRVFTTPGLKQHGEFALSCAIKFLQFFSQVFKIPYALPKMDMLAVPDFSAGAMENWGLVTYRTNSLLFYKGQTSSRVKQAIAYVVAHELAHQWFGNLVTMHDWSELWLNEGFATWVGWYAVDNEFPFWNIWTQFIQGDIARALELDSLVASHPIIVPVKRASDISQIFDAISYSKGASIIRMLAGWLSDKVFLDGVAQYLSKYKYGNATTNMLWDALSTASGKNVSSFMDKWTMCTGYPVLNASIDAAKNSICVSQSRFLSRGSLAKDADSTVWPCPLGLCGYDFMLTEKTASFNIACEDIKTGKIKLNKNQNNFYRARYSQDVLCMFGQCRNLSEADRTGLLSDAFALCKVGLVNTTSALDLCLALSQHRSAYVMLQEISSDLAALKKVYLALGESVYNQVSMLITKIFKPVLDEIGTEFKEDEDHQKSLLRGLAFTCCAVNGNNEVVLLSQKLFASRGEKPLHPNLRGAVYRVAVQNSDGRKAFDEVRAIYEDTALATDHRLAALAALGGSRNKVLLTELLEYTIKNEGMVRPQDWIYSFRSVGSNPIGNELVWAFAKENWDLLEKTFRISLSMIGHFVELTEDWSDTAAAETKITSFFAKRDKKLYDRALAQTLEKIAGNEKWIQRDGESVRAWFSKSNRNLSHEIK